MRINNFHIIYVMMLINFLCVVEIFKKLNVRKDTRANGPVNALGVLPMVRPLMAIVVSTQNLGVITKQYQHSNSYLTIMPRLPPIDCHNSMRGIQDRIQWHKKIDTNFY